jgi:tRNA-dihydrouridine synthase
MAETGVNGIAIGRGALGKPWLFEQLTAHFKGDDIPSAPLPCQRAELLLELGQGVCELYTEMRGMRVMRRLAADFFHGLPGAPQLRKQCSQLSTLDDLRVLAEQLSSIKA